MPLMETVTRLPRRLVAASLKHPSCDSVRSKISGLPRRLVAASLKQMGMEFGLDAIQDVFRDV